MEAATRPAVALCVTGSIAAYKAAEIARGLLAAGVDVVPVMTRAAREFLGPATLSGLTGEAVASDMWDASFAGEMHVAIAKRVKAVVIAPATADVLARLAHGRADDLVTALALLSHGRCLVAPAMHPAMWAHPATQANGRRLAALGYRFVGPVDGAVASGERGVGRMAEPAEVVGATLAALSPQDLAGRHVVVTAGPTVEDLDPVRFLSNRSTGKMGFAVAARAAARGARVTLVTGPVSLPTPWGVARVDVRSARDMEKALHAAMGAGLADADALIMSAAVSDFRPAEMATKKQKKKPGEDARSLALAANPDLLAGVGRARKGKRPVLVGFAVETANDARIEAYARKKLREKKVDLVVANHATDAFGRSDNRATLVTLRRAEKLPTMPKDLLAEHILDAVLRLLGSARLAMDKAIPPLVLLVVGGAVSWAFSPSLAARPTVLWVLAGAYAPLLALAMWRMWRDGTLLDLFRFRSGDVALGIGTAGLLVAACWAGRSLVAPRGSPAEMLVMRVYLQLGEVPADRKAYLLASAGIVFVALAEEVVWRGLVQQVLEEYYGVRAGWLGTAGLYALAHVPTVWLLGVPGAAKNPFIAMAVLLCGIVWGFMVGRLQRLPPALLSHAAFTYTLAMQVRLWSP